MLLCRAKPGRGRADLRKHLLQLAIRIRVATAAARLAPGEPPGARFEVHYTVPWHFSGSEKVFASSSG